MADKPLNVPLGDAPVDPKYANLMGTLAHAVDQILNGDIKPQRNGFVLICFPLDEVTGQGRANYVSNCKRDQVVTMLKQQVRRFEGMPDVTGHG